MKPELEALLKAYDAFKQAPDGPEANRLFALYEAKLEEHLNTPVSAGKHCTTR